MDESLREAIYQQILERVAVMKAAPVWDALPQDAKSAFDARFVEKPLTWAEVSPADKQLIRQGEFQVSAGQGRLTSVAEQGDWAAIDAALDLDGDDDMVALDAALFTVGHGFPKFPWLGAVTTVEEARALGGPVLDPNITDSVGDSVDPDDVPEDGAVEGWVGV